MKHDPKIAEWMREKKPRTALHSAGPLWLILLPIMFVYDAVDRLKSTFARKKND